MVGRIIVVVAVVFFACDRGGEASEETTSGLAEGGTGELGGTPSAGEPWAYPGERRVIDAHSHLFGEGAWEDIGPVLDAHGIEHIFNMSGGSPRRGMGDAMELAEESGDRILNFVTVNWEGFGQPAFGEIAAAELEIAVTHYGYAGLKISKALGLGVVDLDGLLVAIDDPRLFPLWEMAGRLGVPVFIHSGDPAAFWEPVTPENERYAELSAHPSWSFAGPEYPPREELLRQRDHLLELFPGTTFVGVHFGNNPEDLEYVDGVLNRFPNLYVDLAARIPEIGRHNPAVVRELFVRHQERILFGTDIAIGRTSRGSVYMLGSSGLVPQTADQIPAFYGSQFRYMETDDAEMAHPTPIQGDWTIDAIGLPPEVLQRIYYQNAYELVVQPWLERNAPATTTEDPLP